MLSIGEFSHSTTLSIKTIRYYQELGILLPAKIDEGTGYRYFDQKSYDRARSIQMLKDLGFTLKEIRQILSDCRDEEELIQFIDGKIQEVERQIQNLKRMKDQLRKQRKALFYADPGEEGIVEFDFELPCYVSHKFYGTYEQIGDAFSTLYRQYGRFVLGKPYAFYSELGYSGELQNLQAVVEVEGQANLKSGKTEHYPKTRALKIVHPGPYGTQGSSYVQLFTYCRNHGLEIKLPVVEHFIKGPGMIFRGDPGRYKTECILLIGSKSSGDL